MLAAWLLAARDRFESGAWPAGWPEPPRVRRLRPGGTLALRVGDAAGGLRFRLSLWADQLVTLARGHGLARLHARPLDEWAAALRALGLAVQTAPTPGGLPFANTFLIARAPASPA